MTDVANLIVRLPDHPLVTLGAFLGGNPLLDADGVADKLDALGSGQPAIVTLLGGGRVRLERRGPLIAGTPLTDPAPGCDAYRHGYLLMLARKLPNARIPGGDWAAWLDGVPTAALEQALLCPGRTLAILFAAVGHARAGHVDPLQDLYAGDDTHLARSSLAAVVLRAWAACTAMREHIAAGRPRHAVEVVRLFDRAAGIDVVRLPAALIDRLGQLCLEAEHALERDLSDEVA